MGNGDHLPLALYTTWLSMNKVSGRLLRGLGLTLPQYLVMKALEGREAMTVTKIGESLFLDSATLSPLLKRMEQRGLLSRRRGTADERLVQIALMPYGVRLLFEAEMVLSRIVHDTGLTGQDNDGLVRKLDTLRGWLLLVP